MYILSLLLIEILRCTDIVDGDVEVYTVVVAGVVVVGGYIDMHTVVAVGRDTDIYIYYRSVGNFGVYAIIVACWRRCRCEHCRCCWWYRWRWTRWTVVR